MKSSIISIIPKDQLIKIVNNSISRVDVLIKLGVKPQSGNLITLRNRLAEDQICYKHFTTSCSKKKKLDSEVFCINHKLSRSILLPRLKKHVKYECNICKIDKWQNKSLTLQIDHINGNNIDNRIENLRFLCPNCHSLTDTYAGKGKKYNRPKKIKDLEIEKYKLIEKETNNEIKKQRILNSGIDFSKHGWIIKLSELFEITPQALRNWIVHNMLDFYKDNCFKHNSSPFYHDIKNQNITASANG